ncbi:unnamed protein product, partial [Urochloa humidicola]
LVFPGQATNAAAVVRVVAGRRWRQGSAARGRNPFAAKGQKEAAATAQNLLKVDAARARKAGAAQSRKDAAAPMVKAQGRARVPLVREQRSSSWATRVPEQRSSGYGTATPPRSFTDGDCFFNGNVSAFFDSAEQSPVTQPCDSQSSDPATCSCKYYEVFEKKLFADN